VENDLEGAIPEIWETEEDKKLSIDGLRRFYKDFALKNFRHIPCINKNTGWKIRVSAQGIGEIRKFRRREHIILVRTLDTMLENAVFFDTVPDEKNTPGIENVSYFDCMRRVHTQELASRGSLWGVFKSTTDKVCGYVP
jgi:hypothetical protein